MHRRFVRVGRGCSAWLDPCALALCSKGGLGIIILHALLLPASLNISCCALLLLLCSGEEPESASQPVSRARPPQACGAGPRPPPSLPSQYQVASLPAYGGRPPAGPARPSPHQPGGAGRLSEPRGQDCKQELLMEDMDDMVAAAQCEPSTSHQSRAVGGSGTTVRRATVSPRQTA